VEDSKQNNKTHITKNKREDKKHEIEQRHGGRGLLGIEDWHIPLN